MENALFQNRVWFIRECHAFDALPLTPALSRWEGATPAGFSSVVSRQWQSVFAGYWVWMGPEGVKQLNVENSGEKVRFYRVVVE